MNEVQSLFSEEDLSIEMAKDVKITYSDSARVKIIISSPLRKRLIEKGNAKDEFPEGIFVEFLDEMETPKSWLEADYAILNNKEGKIFVRENVKFYNTRNDKLETSELTWDQSTGQMYTEKFVRISQPSKRDTSYGYSFNSNEDFSKFEIYNFQAVKNAKTIESSLR